jgi:hypothetical protein
MTMSERLDRLEASHVRLMTEHEVAWAKHEAFVAQQDLEWERQQQRWQRYDADRAAERERAADLDRRIANLVSGIGEFIRASQGEPPSGY